MNHKFIPARFESLGWNESPKLIVIHWVAGSFSSCVKVFSEGIVRASAHFVVNIDGEIIQMVELNNRAWHAGKSFTQLFGHSANEYSIGIELAGPPSLIGLKGWDKRQIESTQKLILEIVKKCPTIEYITDHSTISPGRKIDVKKGTGKPEDIFPWSELVNGLNLKEIWL
jgi:N-acetyl-anhydromuramyl-L-alanine amidase AmpD